MNFYTKQHQYYCGIDLHAKKMYVCILNQNGDKLVHRNIDTNPDELMRLIAPYREDIVICVECIFTWIQVLPPRRFAAGLHEDCPSVPGPGA